MPIEPIEPTEPVEIPKPTEPIEVPKPTDPAESDKTTEGDLQAELAKWKAMSRKHEGESKANADKAKRFDEFEESQKTEAQKLIDRAEKAEARAIEIEVRATRAEVAAAKGITGEGIKFLTGTTKEELEASADALIAFRGEIKKPPFGQSDGGTDVNGKTDFDTQIAAAQVAGKFQEAIALKQQQHAESLNNK